MRPDAGAPTVTRSENLAVAVTKFREPDGRSHGPALRTGAVVERRRPSVRLSPALRAARAGDVVGVGSCAVWCHGRCICGFGLVGLVGAWVVGWPGAERSDRGLSEFGLSEFGLSGFGRLLFGRDVSER